MPIAREHDFIIQWHLTERCNLACSHCYQTGKDGAGELSLSEIKDIVDEVADMFAGWAEDCGIVAAPSFTLTGGEPFLRTDLAPILEEIAARGFELSLLSNGTLIDRTEAEMLRSFGVKGVQVSIEGPPEVHDEIRGKGSFAASLRGISALRAVGLPVTMNATLSTVNAGFFKELVSLAQEAGAQRLGFSRLVPSGRGAGMGAALLDTEQVRALYSEIGRLAPEGLTLVSGDPVYSQLSSSHSSDEPGSVATGGCAAGLSGVTIAADGTVLPCRRLPVPLGNLRQDSLRELWATSPVLERLRDRASYGGKCGACSRWASCRGCRAIAHAYALYKSPEQAPDPLSTLVADDPQCFLACASS